MKLRLILLSALCLTGLYAEPASVVTGKTANIFLPGEALTFQIRNFAGETAKYEVRDVDGAVLASGDFALFDGNADVSIPSKPEWEKRYLELNLGAKTVPFAILPERTSAKGGDDRFGCWINKDQWHDKQYEAGVRIGVTTSYPHWGLDSTNPKQLYLPKKYGMTITTNWVVAPLSYNYKKDKEILAQPGLMKRPDTADFGKRVEEYVRNSAWPKGLIRTSDSLSGEYCFFDTVKADNLRDQHRIFYDAVKRGAPEMKVGLGLFMAYGASSLKSLLAGTTPETLKFDYVCYDVCGIGDGIEDFLKSEIRIMDHWGKRVPQWVCEIWGGDWEEHEAAASICRIYGACLGLNCVEVDWHAADSRYETKEEWEEARRQKKIPAIFLPKFSQALFRGKNYNITQSGIAYFHLYDKLSFARPLGEIQDDFNLASYQFRKKDGSFVTMFWTRRYPVELTIGTDDGTIRVTDFMGNHPQTLTPADGSVAFSLKSYPVYVESASKLKIKECKISSRNWCENKVRKQEKGK